VFTVDVDPSDAKLRQFAAMLVVAPLAWAAIRWSIAVANPLVVVLLGVCIALGLFGLVAPRIVRWLFVGASYATFPLGLVLGFVVLGIIYFLVIGPVALVMRGSGRDPLRLRKPPPGSLWLALDGEKTPAYYLRQ
jgi:hypothetical protein